MTVGNFIKEKAMTEPKAKVSVYSNKGELTDKMLAHYENKDFYKLFELPKNEYQLYVR